MGGCYAKNHKTPILYVARKAEFSLSLESKRGKSVLKYRLGPGKLCALQKKASKSLHLTRCYYLLLCLLTEEQSNVRQCAQTLS